MLGWQIQIGEFNSWCDKLDPILGQKNGEDTCSQSNKIPAPCVTSQPSMEYSQWSKIA